MNRFALALPISLILIVLGVTPVLARTTGSGTVPSKSPPVVTTAVPSPSEPQQAQPESVWLYVRVKHDLTPRQVLTVSPETVPLSNQPGDSHKGPTIPIDPAWQDFDAAINSPKAFRWLLMPHSALVNIEYGPGEDPQAESLTFGGNVLLIDQIVGNYGHIRSYGYADSPPLPSEINYQTYPEFIQKVTAIDSRSGIIRNPGAALDVYFALLHKTDLWINLDDVEPFPSLPVTVKPQDWITRGLRVHESCEIGSPTVNGLYPSQTATLFSYAPRGSDVLGWVQLPDKSFGCIALNYRSTDYTGWNMQTIPPVRPVR